MPIEAAIAVALSLAASLLALWYASREIAKTRTERDELLEERRSMLTNPDVVPLPMAMLPFANLRSTDEIAVWEQSTIFTFGHWRSPCAYSSGKIIDTISGIVIENGSAWMRCPPAPDWSAS